MPDIGAMLGLGGGKGGGDLGAIAGLLGGPKGGGGMMDVAPELGPLGPLLGGGQGAGSGGQDELAKLLKEILDELKGTKNGGGLDASGIFTPTIGRRQAPQGVNYGAILRNMGR